jgi:hypothetical protein
MMQMPMKCRGVRIGLPYYNDFMWGDRTRKLETKPAGMVSRDIKPGDSTLTQEGMNERKAPEIVSVGRPTRNRGEANCR